MASNNPRYDCSSPTCKAKITRNQLRASNGICIYCKTPMAHTQWMGRQQATLGQLLSLEKGVDEELKELAKDSDFEVKDLIAAAIAIKIEQWLAAEDNIKAVKQDLMLAKLMRR